MGKKEVGGGDVKYLPQSLKEEYEYLERNNPDIEGIEHPMINLSDTFRAYLILVHYFTDESSADERESMLVGIRSVDLLASAIGRQNISFCGRMKYTRPLDICATLFFGLVKNHSFNDGNKRTALLILLYQLQLYGYSPIAAKKDFEKLVLSVARSSIPQDYKKEYYKFRKEDDRVIKTISFLLKRMTKKKDNSYHISPSMNDFCAALRNLGVECELENGKIRFTYKSKMTWRCIVPQEKHFYISFGGWTRTVGAKTARDTLSALGLYDQFPTYQDLLNNAEPLYELVDNFKEPLRRLKDE